MCCWKVGFADGLSMLCGSLDELNSVANPEDIVYIIRIRRGESPSV